MNQDVFGPPSVSWGTEKSKDFGKHFTQLLSTQLQENPNYPEQGAREAVESLFLKIHKT